MLKLIKEIGQYGLTCIGIILLLASPAMIGGLNTFTSTILTIMKNILQPHTLSYYVHSETRSYARMPEVRSEEFHQQAVTIDLFPYITDSYFYSLTLLLGSFIIAVFIVMIASMMYIHFPPFLKKIILATVGILESLPDVFFIFSIQLSVVWFYKQTGIELAAAYSTDDKPAYLLPLLTLSVVPCIYLLKMNLLFMKEEMEKDYVLFAKSKGISNAAISFHHILKNTVMECLTHLPVIILVLVTNLVVLEFLFNSSGIMRFIIGDQPAASRAFMLILLMTPLFIVVKGTIHYRQRFYGKKGGGNG
ncbi:ABC transporter permease subunit [Rossellomorea aquimaris]|jgi:peptide/nickel transport system permease protein|uniref:ABC transporter permease subunit n=1 Tax=Rossellomorea aquimaris TaxID=189382 RepID=UPI0016537940|nr:ABC transporter permease subunit [Rossellomorea aquimaris]